MLKLYLFCKSFMIELLGPAALLLGGNLAS